MQSILEPRPSSSRAIPVRRLDVDMGALTDADWIVEDDPVFSHFMATLSAVFPRGEEFFVATVREHRAVAGSDPVLKAQIKAFAGQEAMHGRQHRALNSALGAGGYRTAKAERDIGRRLDAIMKLRPRTLPLAVTAGSEHLTGILAESVLSHRRTRQILLSDPRTEPLLTWHSLEELEHKNVAFDVLARSGAGYPVRVAGFAIAVGVLGGYVLREWAAAVVSDRGRIRPRHLPVFVGHLRRQKMLSLWSLRRTARYLRPGFHPDDMDTEALVEEWRARLARVTTVTAGMRD